MKIAYIFILSVFLCSAPLYANAEHQETIKKEDIKAPQEAGVKEINLEAFQYGFSPEPVVVKKGDIVKLDITSRDVAHGVYIKEYGINVSVNKGEHKKIEFFADKEGKFDIICSVYCGPGHSRMRGNLIVEE